MVRVAINGFGRIGRQVFKVLFEKYRDQVEVVAVNDLTDVKTLAHLLKYDSNYGKFDADIRTEGEYILVDNVKIKVLAEPDPAKLPWKDLNIDIVVESTGNSGRGIRQPSTSRQVPRRLSSPLLPRAKISPLSLVLTMRSMTLRSTILSPMLLVQPTVWHLLPKFLTISLVLSVV